jgi:VIT1/CCC1 family predicted Fe2+/Mn2+ transporter
VFGGIDGIMSSTIIISGAAGGKLPWRIILIIGISNLVANSLSIGISEFLSSRAHREFLLAEKRRERWEYKHYKDNEIAEVQCEQLFTPSNPLVIQLFMHQ